MPEDDIVKKLVGELNRGTEPYAAWNAAKPAIEKGAKAVVGTGKYNKPLKKGAAVVDAIENLAVDWYGGKTGDAKQLAHMLRVDLGQNYGPFREAVKIGDEITAAFLLKTATENMYTTSTLEAIAERAAAQHPDKRIALGKEFVKLVHGDDYVAAATNPGALAQTLGEQKKLAKQYMWN